MRLTNPEWLLAGITVFFFTACSTPEPQKPKQVAEIIDGIPLCPPLINTDRPPNLLEFVADVTDLDISESYYAIPEIVQEKRQLVVDLHTYYRHFMNGPDHVWLRSYDAEQGEEVDVPLGPTIRVKPNGRLTIRVHNDLPLNENWNYLYMLDDTEANRKLLDAGPSQALIDLLANADSAEVKRRNSSTGMIHLTTTSGMTVTRDQNDKLGKWRITANDSAMIVKCRMNWQQQKLMLFTYLEFYADNTNISHDFNNTNMHFHGSHVSPFQDDVLRNVSPRYSSYYTYDIVDHQPGTFWYHPHVHGSTAMQVASGMGGVIIVEEDNLDDFPALKAASSEEHERVMIFDQLQYDTINGELTDFEMLDLLGGFQGSQTAGARGTTVNGRIKPSVTLQAGEVARWRLLHKGFHSALALRFPDEIEVYQIAVDGIMFDEPRRITSLHMAPGNRSDILVKVPIDVTPQRLQVKSVTYIPACEYFPEDDQCTAAAAEDTEPMFYLAIGEQMQREMRIPRKLPARAPELRQNIRPDEISKVRRTQFNIANGEFMINNQPFDGNRIDNTPLLDSKEQWNISSLRGGHPYHIHINPFQVVEYGGRKLNFPMWKDVVFANNGADSAIAYTHYDKYWGDFVLHCHILDHEDRGMMQRVTIVRYPDGTEYVPDRAPEALAAE